MAIKIFETSQKNIANLKATFLVTKSSNFAGELPILYTNKYKLVANFFKIRSFAKNGNIVHAIDSFPFGVIGALACIGTDTKLVITGIGSGAIQMFDHYLYKYLLRWAYRRATVVTAISHYIASEIKKNVPELDVIVINPGIDFDEMKKVDISRQLPEEVVFKKPFILTVGMIKRRKGYHVAIPAFAEVLKKFPDLKYVIVGYPSEKADEDYKMELKKLAIDLGVADRVFFLGFIDDRSDLYAIYRNAELFCLLPQDIGKDVEGFGLVFLEAAVNGLPVVAGSGSGADDAVLDGENGYLVSSSDVMMVSQAIIKILDNKELRNNFKISSQQFALRMNWDTIGLKYIDIYNKIIKTS